jgi:hypothetical protein
MSMSWIIRSSITLTSVARGVNGARRVDSRHQAVLPGRFDQLAGFIDRLGDRFFDQTVNSRFQKIAPDFIMRTGGNDQADRVDQRHDIAVVGVGVGAMFLRDFPGGLGIGIDHRDQFTIGGCGILVGVPFAEMTDTDNGNLE